MPPAQHGVRGRDGHHAVRHGRHDHHVLGLDPGLQLDLPGQPNPDLHRDQSRPIPFELPGVTISQSWHVRNDGDAAHRWLRSRVSLLASTSTQP